MLAHRSLQLTLQTLRASPVVPLVQRDDPKGVVPKAGGEKKVVLAARAKMEKPSKAAPLPSQKATQVHKRNELQAATAAKSKDHIRLTNERMAHQLREQCPFASYVNVVNHEVWDPAQRGGRGAWVQNRWVAKSHAVVSACRWTAHLPRAPRGVPRSAAGYGYGVPRDAGGWVMIHELRDAMEIGRAAFNSHLW